MLDDQTCFAAMLRRDHAFDGRFFVAVRTTGIYCRPVCSARMPKRENIFFLPSAAACELLGFRPCLRCRPETAPFCPAWNGTKTTVERALRLIEAGELDRATVEGLADRLGVGSRHLTRLFAKHLRASPSEVAKTRRIQRARLLLADRSLALGEIALRAGFLSARRMTTAFVELDGRPPSALRDGLRPNMKGDPSTRPLAMAPARTAGHRPDAG